MQALLIFLAVIGTLWIVCMAFLGAIMALFAYEELQRQRKAARPRSRLETEVNTIVRSRW